MNNDHAHNGLAIHTEGLGKRFGERVALESIDLEVPRGSAFGFLGPNGAGKTTLIRLRLRDRVQAVIYAYETGLVAPADAGE